MIGFFGSVLDLDEWCSGSDAAGVDVENGVLTMHKMDALTRQLPPMERFEILVEFPPGADNSTQLALLTEDAIDGGVKPAGSVSFEIEGNAAEVKMYGARAREQSAPISESPDERRKPNVYRLFCDSLCGRICGFRNGAKLFELNKPEENADGKASPPGLFRTLVLHRFLISNDVGLQVSRLETRPWDGQLLDDRLPNAEKARDEITSISETEIVQSGMAKPIVAGVSLCFGNPVVQSGKFDSRLDFGGLGQLSAADLRIEAGKVTGQFTFGQTRAMPLEAVREIVFPQMEARPSGGDLLIFRNGDQLRGFMSRSKSDGALYWKIGDRPEVMISPEGVAGVRFEKEFVPSPTSSESGILEMRNGDLLRGELAEIDGANARLDEVQAGTLAMPSAQLWRYLPKEPAGWCDGGFDPVGWLSSGPADSWIYLDGKYVCGSRSPSLRQTSGVRAPAQNLPERFELGFDIASSTAKPPEFTLSIGDRASTSWLSIEYGQKGAFFTAAHRNGNGVASIPQPINLGDCCAANPSKLGLRAFVDSRNGGIVEVYFNGTRCARIGSKLEDRSIGLERKVSIQVDGAIGKSTVLSDLRIEPWNGEAPEWKHGDGFIYLSNGDVVSGITKSLRNGQLGIESAAGRLKLPVTEMEDVEFGGAKNWPRPAMCVRLLDGGVIHLHRFQWDGRDLVGQSDALGELRLPGTALAELVWTSELIQPRSKAGNESTVQATTLSK